jgi:hypothetical protein
MASFEVIAIVISILGLAASITYYAIVLSNANKTQKQQLETRQTQLFMNLFQTVTSVDFNQRYQEMLGAEWTDYEDYLEKFGPTRNPNGAARRFTTWQVYNGIGFLVMEDYMDIEKVELLFGGSGPIMLWKKWEPIILDLRERMESPLFMRGFEHLASKLEERRTTRGLPSDKSFEDLEP